MTNTSKVTVSTLAEKKRAAEPIVMVTAYDHPSASVAEEAGVDVVLVGDSAATTVLGYEATTPVTVEEMLVLTKAVRRGLRTPLMVGDLPFGSYEVSDEQAVTTAVRFVQEAGCDAVKLEGGADLPCARAGAIVRAGIPVMGHVGLTPQTASALGGWKAQGRTADAAARIAEQARSLEGAGCFALVIEAVPADAVTATMSDLGVPTIGIGAGPSTDGQVLVFHDLLGIREGKGAKFVKRYASLRDDMVAGITAYAAEVRGSRYPAPEHTYSMASTEADKLRRLVGA